MKLTVRVVSTRQKRHQSYGTVEEYDAVNIADARLTKRATAEVLRAIANDLDPLFPALEPTSVSMEDQS